MTRKDYILIAEALKASSPVEAHRFSAYPSTPNEAFVNTLVAVTDALAKDNPRFNRDHFIAVVCGEKDLHSRPPRS